MPKEKLSTKKLTRIFKALANERRLIIIKSVSDSSGFVSDLADRLKISVNCVSRHLQKLERESLISKEQKGKYAIYRVSSSFKKSGLMNQIKGSE
jgi:ArsR family transcriptional regulator